MGEGVREVVGWEGWVGGFLGCGKSGAGGGGVGGGWGASFKIQSESSQAQNLKGDTAKASCKANDPIRTIPNDEPQANDRKRKIPYERVQARGPDRKQKFP